jgi:hypothetical protein
MISIDGAPANKHKKQGAPDIRIVRISSPQERHHAEHS